MLANLESTGWLKARPPNVLGLTSPGWLEMAKSMELLDEEAVTCRGWMPLAARLVALGRNNQWNKIGSSLKRGGEVWWHKGSR